MKCPHCGGRVLSSQQKWQRARLAAGDCGVCGRPREHRAWFRCVACQRRENTRAQVRYRAKKARAA
jgi:hypothetical protein